MFNRLCTAVAAFAVVALAWTPQVMAQQDPAPQQQTAPQAQHDFDDAKLVQFASAADDMAGVAQEYETRLQNATSEEEGMRLREEANAEMMGILQENGLSVEEYNQILTAALSDPALHARIIELAE
ncbi:DUF4168 domain-containing protein [Telmatospirillum sp. J64-1]|uniref:DUF4168 domain-containing protein n=1 Tax=Telmatospirillum sp. J64-1 TaxID=2502183 RepID=UPI00163D5033|nr:DUF4168 domain-containing protein [Telmatospirillum sp. J64-1]